MSLIPLLQGMLAGGADGKFLYVSLYVTANNGGSLDQVTEMEVAEAPGGANVCVGGTASASNYYDAGTYPASKAFDGSKTTNVDSWVGTGAKPYRLTYQFAAPKTIAEVRLWGAVAVVNNRGPRDFLIQGSNNGSDWTTLKSLTGEVYSGDYQQKTYVI